MNKELIKNALIVLLAAITALSVYKYAAFFKEKVDFLHSLEQMKQQIELLDKEKQNLLQELGKEKTDKEKVIQQNGIYKENLRAGKSRLDALFVDYGQLKKAVDDSNTRISLLKAENDALTQEKSKIKAQADLTAQENETLKARLSSIVELKKAIREVKLQMRKVGKEMIHNVEVQKAVEGNRGYLVKDGQINIPAKVKIEVVPAPVKE